MTLSTDAMLSGSDFAHLRAFVAVAQALSFTRAAGTLGVTPSAPARWFGSSRSGSAFVC